MRRDFSTKENSGEKNSEKKKKGKKYSKQRQYTRPRLFMSKNLKHLYEEQSKNHSNTAQTQGSARGEYCGRRKRNNIQAFAKIAGVVTRGTACCSRARRAWHRGGVSPLGCRLRWCEPAWLPASRQAVRPSLLQLQPGVASSSASCL